MKPRWLDLYLFNSTVNPTKPPNTLAVRVVAVQHESAPRSVSREALVEQPSPELLADKVDPLLKLVNGTKVIRT